MANERNLPLSLGMPHEPGLSSNVPLRIVRCGRCVCAVKRQSISSGMFNALTSWPYPQRGSSGVPWQSRRRRPPTSRYRAGPFVSTVRNQSVGRLVRKLSRPYTMSFSGDSGRIFMSIASWLPIIEIALFCRSIWHTAFPYGI